MQIIVFELLGARCLPHKICTEVISECLRQIFLYNASLLNFDFTVALWWPSLSASFEHYIQQQNQIVLKRKQYIINELMIMKTVGKSGKNEYGIQIKS